MNAEHDNVDVAISRYEWLKSGEARNINRKVTRWRCKRPLISFINIFEFSRAKAANGFVFSVEKYLEILEIV